MGAGLAGQMRCGFSCPQALGSEEVEVPKACSLQVLFSDYAALAIPAGTAPMAGCQGESFPAGARQGLPFADVADAFLPAALFYDAHSATTAEVIRRREAHGSGEASSLLMLAESCQPLLFAIAEFLAASPKSAVGLCSMASFTMAAQARFLENALWSKLHRTRWPALHACLRHGGPADWRRAYGETLAGRGECVLEVYNREQKRGFNMSAMPARVRYDAAAGGYRAKYVSASDVPEETIPVSEEARLRFCPAVARRRLPAEAPADAGKSAAYPYRVMEGTHGLVVGQGVELQWKMQEASPFGWWYADLEELVLDRATGQCAKATITFPHFSSASRWHRMEVEFGDSQIRANNFGGYTGGIRGLSPEERARWLQFLPKPQN